MRTGQTNLVMADTAMYDTQLTFQTSNSKKFIFNDYLNVNYIEDFYQGDYDDLCFAFKLFLNQTLSDVYDLLNAGYCQDWEIFKDLLHKVKPTIEVVGLTEMSQYFLRIRSLNFDEKPESEIDSILNFLKISFDFYEDLIKEERQKLLCFLRENNAISKRKFVSF